jgi:hypothetical protein
MKYFKRIIPIIALLICIFIFPMPSHADFGDFAGDSDFGGGDWGDSDDDYSYGDSHSRNYSGDDETSLKEWIIIFGFLGLFGGVPIILVIYASINSNKRPTDRGNPMVKFKEIDPQFSEAEFKEKLAEFYVHFQRSWQAKDITDLRPYLTDTLYNKCDLQLDSYRKNNQTNHVDDPKVLSVELKYWKAEQNNHLIIAEINACIIDYVTDDKTGAVVRGSRTDKKYMTYEWTLKRSADRMTASRNGTVVTCPYCGAEVNINNSAVCEYCDSVLHTDSFDWTVSFIRGISQRTEKQ